MEVTRTSVAVRDQLVGISGGNSQHAGQSCFVRGAEEQKVALSLMVPYSQFLDLREYFQAASPTDFRKSISAMGAETNGFTVAAAQAIGALGVRKSDTSVAMVSVHRKLIKNEWCASFFSGIPSGATQL